MPSKQSGLSEATKMPAGTSTLAFSQSLGDEKPRLLGFLAGLLDRCIFGVTPPCLEHWLMDRKDFFSCFMTEEIFPGFSSASAVQKIPWLESSYHANRARAAAIVTSREPCRVTVLSAQRCPGARKASLSRAALWLARCRRTLVTEAFSADGLHPERSLGFSPGWHYSVQTRTALLK